MAAAHLLNPSVAASISPAYHMPPGKTAESLASSSVVPASKGQGNKEHLIAKGQKRLEEFKQRRRNKEAPLRSKTPPPLKKDVLLGQSFGEGSDVSESVKLISGELIEPIETPSTVIDLSIQLDPATVELDRTAEQDEVHVNYGSTSGQDNRASSNGIIYPSHDDGLVESSIQRSSSAGREDSSIWGSRADVSDSSPAELANETKNDVNASKSLAMKWPASSRNDRFGSWLASKPPKFPRSSSEDQLKEMVVNEVSEYIPSISEFSRPYSKASLGQATSVTPEKMLGGLDTSSMLDKVSPRLFSGDDSEFVRLYEKARLDDEMRLKPKIITQPVGSRSGQTIFAGPVSEVGQQKELATSLPTAPLVPSLSIAPLNYEYHREESTAFSSVTIEPSTSQAHYSDVPATKAFNHYELQNASKDEFAALEQHIQDLTQEKFSLQRGLDAARTLAENLAQENSALTEDFNQQGALITDLRTEITRQAEALRDQERRLIALKAEKDKSQQDSSTAVERSQALAAEVVDLEERILKLRSSELKLEKQVDSLGSELDQYKKQIATLEKDRTNLKSLVDALQEEKKILQQQIRKKGGKTVANQLAPKADACTSTEDLIIESSEQPSSSTTNHGDQDMYGRSEIPRASENSSAVTYEAPLVARSSIPLEHMRTVDNINLLLKEVAEEKTMLLQSLRSESSVAAQLRVQNEELSRKLERQTQHLELVVAQNMARTGNPTPLTLPETPFQPVIEYVDEGDEVVDRVLRWIMTLFPGGSSKRSASKLS